jgi:hypothetical protein
MPFSDVRVSESTVIYCSSTVPHRQRNAMFLREKLSTPFPRGIAINNDDKMAFVRQHIYIFFGSNHILQPQLVLLAHGLNNKVKSSTDHVAGGGGGGGEG